MKPGHRLILLAGVPAATFVVASATCVLGDYQGVGGDFAQYITHARNLMLGRPYSWLMEGFPSVLPGYPAVLAGLTAAFGVDFFVYGLLNSLCWAGYAVLAVVFYQSRLATRTQVFVLVAIIVFSHFAIHFQQDVQPNMLYALVAMGALVAAQRLVEQAGRPTARYVLLALVLLLPALVRKEALALYAVLLIYFGLNRRWSLACVPILAMLAIAAFDITAVDTLEQNSTFRNFARRYLTEGGPTGPLPLARGEAGPIVAFVYAILTYLVALVGFLIPDSIVRWASFSIEFAPGAALRMSPVSIGVIGLFAWSYFRGKLLALDKLFFAAHLTVVALFSILWIKSGQIPTRYALPVYALFWFYVVVAVAPWVRRMVRFDKARIVLAGGVAVAAVSATALQWQTPMRRNDTSTAEIRELIDWLADGHTHGEIGYFKNRVLIMLLDEAGHPRATVSRLRSSTDAQRLLGEPGNVLVVRNLRGYGQPAVKRAVEAGDADLVLENERVSVYRVRSPKVAAP